MYHRRTDPLIISSLLQLFGFLFPWQLLVRTWSASTCNSVGCCSIPSCLSLVLSSIDIWHIFFVNLKISLHNGWLTSGRLILVLSALSLSQAVLEFWNSWLILGCFFLSYDAHGISVVLFRCFAHTIRCSPYNWNLVVLLLIFTTRNIQSPWTQIYPAEIPRPCLN